MLTFALRLQYYLNHNVIFFIGTYFLMMLNFTVFSN